MFSPDACTSTSKASLNYPIAETQGPSPPSLPPSTQPTSTRLAHASGGAAVEIWDIETRSRTSLLRYPALANDVSFSPDGRLVLVALLDGTVCVHDAHTAKEVFLLKGHKDRATKARFSPCGTYIASASWDRTVRVWKTSDGSQVATLSEHDDRVEHLVFSPDGKTLSSGGMGGTVVIRRMHDIVSL
uniref:Sulfatase domain-containing protein n=1 Tax=Ganoderma boninense TaxID=34458 RepID=A0A5K1K1U3_9APHY|nr:Sulfatase domain-containing protein [Ganoderma boninense]